MALDTSQLVLIEQRVANDGPNTAVAYLFWLFLGGFGAHRFYLGRTGSAVAQLLCTITVVGILISGPWVLIDVFLIPGMLRQKREALRQSLMTNAMAYSGAQAPVVS